VGSKKKTNGVFANNGAKNKKEKGGVEKHCKSRDRYKSKKAKIARKVLGSSRCQSLGVVGWGSFFIEEGWFWGNFFLFGKGSVK